MTFGLCGALVVGRLAVVWSELVLSVVVGSVAATCFGAVHSVVGAAQYVVGGAGVAGWDDDDTDARLWADVVAGDGGCVQGSV